MSHPYFPQTEADIQHMLEVIGVSSLDELFRDIPEELRLKGDYQLPEGLSEVEVRQSLQQLGKLNKQLVCFAGDGAYDHYTPSLVPYLASRSEFLTSYTPYQPEISQGTLQYIFEYQSLIAELTGMEVSNASMYDGATATAEALMMAIASVKRRNKVLVSATLAPRVLSVVKTYARFHGFELELIPATDGVTDLSALASLLTPEVAAVLMPQPNYYGIVEDLTGVADTCHANGSLLIVQGLASPLGTLKSPGEWGADIACGDAQSLGIPLSVGGPYIGYLCTKQTLVRKLPGRIVGATVDAEGNRVFVLTLQAREQHIRRDKATSNICTAQGVMCLYVAAYLSLMGPKGLTEVNEASYAGAHQLHDMLLATGRFTEVFPEKPFYNEFCLSYKGDVDKLIHRCIEGGILPGVKAEGVEQGLLVAVTEKRSPEEMQQLIQLINEEED